MSQHFAAVYGDYAQELIDLCYLLDIKAIVETVSFGSKMEYKTGGMTYDRKGRV